ncbi:hypothetical protein [Oceanobacillus polygoni]|uniref:Uncharacterized protein n=1 Tax=Oceanobacillus polygoni TaxID=1235259 RepID=A0A9X1CIP9_9BACI|nr:hypothetical protein [Oceanobacillus polygoni]MBP2078598.1 hypothetical protein [Oceanobacillus polygoni]
MADNIEINKLIAVLEQSELNLLVDLRTGDGFNEKAYEKVVEMLTLFEKEWKEVSSIPKEVATIMVELYGELYNFSLNYSGEESERILKAAKNIKRLIEECLEGIEEAQLEKNQLFTKLFAYINEDGHFFEKLRSGKGFDDQQFEKIYEALESIMDEVHSWETLPKAFITILINFYEMDLFVYTYQEEFHQEEEADKIYDAYERVFELIAG